MASIIKGYQCVLAVSSKSSQDKIDMLRAIGAAVYVCPGHVKADDPRSYYQVAKRLHCEIKGSVYINQYFNELNTEAHFRQQALKYGNKLLVKSPIWWQQVEQVVQFPVLDDI